MTDEQLKGYERRIAHLDRDESFLKPEVRELISALRAANTSKAVLVEALTSIAKNSCCDQCQEAKKVAEQALRNSS